MEAIVAFLHSLEGEDYQDKAPEASRSNGRAGPLLGKARLKTRPTYSLFAAIHELSGLA